MTKILYIEQGTDEWLEARKGKLTASHATAIGNQKSGLDTYVTEICADIVGKKDRFTNKYMDRGNFLEGYARRAYEFETGNTVQEVGLGIYNDYVAASPDGLIDPEGGIEIKCRDNEKHFVYITTGKVESSSVWQMNMNMIVFDRKWWDFVSYNPNHQKPLFIRRFEQDIIMRDKLLKGFEIGEQKIKEQMELYNKFELKENE
jgi:hypothetical protein